MYAMCIISLYMLCNMYLTFENFHKVHVHSLTHVKSVEFKKGEDRAVSVVVWGGHACIYHR